MAILATLARTKNYTTGITGIAPGSVGILMLPTDRRYHQINLQTSAIAYQSPTVTLKAGDTGNCTFAATVVNGVITAISNNGGTSTEANGTYPLTIVDSLYTSASGLQYRVGQGATGTYTVAAGVVTASAVTLGGVASPTPPELVVQTVKQIVNGVPMRDVPTWATMKMIGANPFKGPMGMAAYPLSPGELPIFYTEPWRAELQHNETTSWDMAGQSSFEIDFLMQANVSQPSIIGSTEFDYRRNQRPDANSTAAKPVAVPFLNPITHHMYGANWAAGTNDLVTLPVSWPFLRIWILLSAGAVNWMEILAAGNKLIEETISEQQQSLGKNGFNTNLFSAAYLSDPDQRLYKALALTGNPQ